MKLRLVIIAALATFFAWPVAAQVAPSSTGTPTAAQNTINSIPWVNGKGLWGGQAVHDNLQSLLNILNGMGTWDPVTGKYTGPPPTPAQVQAGLGYSPVNKAGDGMTGPLGIAATVSVTGATPLSIFGGSLASSNLGLSTIGTTNGTFAGTYTGGYYSPLVGILNNDNTVNTNMGGSSQALFVQENALGASGNGNKTGITSILHWTGGATGPISGFYTSAFAQTYLDATGQQSPTGGGYGDFYGLASLIQAGCGCTITGLTSYEADYGLFTGTSANYKYGIRIIGVNGDNTHAVTSLVPGGHSVAANTSIVQEAMLDFTRDGNTTVGMDCGICFGSINAYWPIDINNGTIIGVLPSSIVQVAGNSGTPSPIQAKYGVDFSAVSLTGAAWRSPGLTLGATGAIFSTAGVLQVSNLPSAAPTGTIKGSACVDSAGNFYVKTTTGSCL